MITQNCFANGCRIEKAEGYTMENHVVGCRMEEPQATRPEDNMQLELPAKFPVRKYPLDEAPLKAYGPFPKTELYFNFRPFIEGMQKAAKEAGELMQKIGKNYKIKADAKKAITTSYAPVLGPATDI